jgi:FAS-associated factor 2
MPDINQMLSTMFSSFGGQMMGNFMGPMNLNPQSGARKGTQDRLYSDKTLAADPPKLHQEFESKYGKVHPKFFQGSYFQAVEQSKKVFKFILVYIHSNTDQCDLFCRYFE